MDTTPISYTDENPTGCCPVFNHEAWDGLTLEWDKKTFIKDHTWSFFYVPLNMKQVMNRARGKIEQAKAGPKDNRRIMLSHDLSLWKCEHLFTVQKEVPDADNVELSGTFMTKVFEGPYKNAGKRSKEMKEYVEGQGKEMKKLYFFYTTCPKCMKYYGKNWVVAFAQIT